MILWIIGILVGFWVLGFMLDMLEDGGWLSALAVVGIIWIAWMVR